jgi:gluconolactonase
MEIDELRVVVDGLDHPEGVATAADGTLYAGGELGQVYRVDPVRGSFEQVAECGGFMLGLAVDGDGFVYGCNLGRKILQRIDPRTGDVEMLSAGPPGRPFQTPNWCLFTPGGRLLVTDSGGWQHKDGFVALVEPDGTTSVWSDEVNDFPNGACLSADGSGVLVLESLAPTLSLIPFGTDERPGPRKVVAQLPGTVPDGVSVDVTGRAYVFCYRPDRILTVDLDGTVAVLVDDALGTTLSAPTNGVWIGPDLDELVVGNLGRWHLTALRPGPRGVDVVRPRGWRS